MSVQVESVKTDEVEVEKREIAAICVVALLLLFAGGMNLGMLLERGKMRSVLPGVTLPYCPFLVSDLKAEPWPPHGGDVHSWRLNATLTNISPTPTSNLNFLLSLDDGSRVPLTSWHDKDATAKSLPPTPGPLRLAPAQSGGINLFAEDDNSLPTTKPLYFEVGTNDGVFVFPFPVKKSAAHPAGAAASPPAP